MRPQVVAHRGASHDIAEHTLNTYLARFDAGAGGARVRRPLTADGRFVYVDDRDLRRTSGGPRGLV